MMARRLAWALVRGASVMTAARVVLCPGRKGVAVGLLFPPVAGEVGEEGPLLLGEEGLGVEPSRPGVKGAAQAVDGHQGVDGVPLLQAVARRPHPSLDPTR
jgi:hypothetical protein